MVMLNSKLLNYQRVSHLLTPLAHKPFLQFEQQHERHTTRRGAGNITTWSCLLIIEAGKVNGS